MEFSPTRYELNASPVILAACLRGDDPLEFFNRLRSFEFDALALSVVGICFFDVEKIQAVLGLLLFGIHRRVGVA